MSAQTSKLFAQGYLTGFFDMIGTMVGQQPTHQLNTVEEIAATNLADLAKQYGALVKASAQGGGAVALLFPAPDTYRIAAKFLREEPAPKDSLAQEDLANLKEVYHPCLGAGANFFKEKYGRTVTLENIEMVPGGEAAVGSLTALFGEGAVRAQFTYSVPPEIESAGVLLFTKDLAESIPLGGVGEQGVEKEVAEAPTAQPPVATANLDMILDIRLVAKARLGRVEMPISELLELGPGSIIEVGHLVEEPIELLVNDKLIARGDVVVVDEKFGLRITEIVSPRERIESLR